MTSLVMKDAVLVVATKGLVHGHRGPPEQEVLVMKMPVAMARGSDGASDGSSAEAPKACDRVMEGLIR